MASLSPGALLNAKNIVVKPTIVLAEDDAALLKSVQKLLESEFTIVASVGDGQALIEAVQALKPDLIVADISMPLVNGINAARSIIAAHPDARIIFLTVHEEPAFVAKARKSGALGYVIKRFAPSHLVPAIREVLQGRAFVCPSLLE